MSQINFTCAAALLAAVSMPSVAEARSQMRAVGSSTVYPFAIPAIRAFVAEFTKESTSGPNGYLKQIGLVASPNKVRAKSQLAARNLSPLNLASVK